MTPEQIVGEIREKGVHLEPIENGSYLARIGGEGDELYENAIVLSPVSPGVYEAKGLIKLPTLKQRRKLREAMRAKGFRMIYRRVRKIK